MRARHVAGVAVTAASVLLILALTLRSNPGLAEHVAQTPLLCLPCGEEGVTDFLLNAVLFAPLGVGLALSGVGLRWIVVGGFLLSLAVETIQYGWLIGRDASLSDLLSNALGASLGAAVALMLPRMLEGTARSMRWRFGAALGTCWIVLATGGWALLPRTDEADAWQLLVAPRAPDKAIFAGRLDTIRVGTALLTAGRPLDRLAVEEGLAAPMRTLHLAGRGAGVADPEAEVLRLVGDGRWHVTLGQEWCAFTFRGRRNASRLRLHDVGVWVDAPCAEGADAPFSLDIAQSAHHLSMAYASPAGRRSVGVPLRLATSWTHVWPYVDYLSPPRPAAEAAWLALLALPVGFWAMPSAVPLLADMVAGLALLPLLSATLGLAAPTGGHFLAIATGTLAGRLAWRLAERWRRTATQT